MRDIVVTSAAFAALRDISELNLRHVAGPADGRRACVASATLPCGAR
jgi:hypothetical protein